MTVWFLILLLVLLPQTALAHTGPPYVVVPDQRVGPYTLTVWADPDVGRGSFIIEAMADDAPLPEATQVRLRAQPAAGGAEVRADAARQTTNDGRVFVAELPFASEGQWQAMLTIDGPQGRIEQPFSLEVTPALESWLTSLLCLVPFAALAGLWIVGLRRQRAATRKEP